MRSLAGRWDDLDDEQPEGPVIPADTTEIAARAIPKPIRVSRKARAISTGVKVPRVCKPPRLRRIRITSTPIGIMIMIW